MADTPLEITREPLEKDFCEDTTEYRPTHDGERPRFLGRNPFLSSQPTRENDPDDLADTPTTYATTTAEDDLGDLDDDDFHPHRFFHLRPADDDEPEDWWFASTAIPLLAAAMGPMANVFSIASIVSSWKETYDPNFPGVQDAAIGIRDPRWEVDINAVSLVCGFIGNLFLLFNFTRAVRYIVALPCTIILWFTATGLLTGIIISMHLYRGLADDGTELWGQAFWYAVMAAVLYMAAATILMINMLGYFLGHYTQHFELTDEQRNLILQTMMFVLWLAGGAGVFTRLNDWKYSDALYFADVTILTVGFGDFTPQNDTARGLVFPFTVGGIITLGLVVTSINKFATQIGHSKIVHKRIETRRAKTMERTAKSSFEVQERQEKLRRQLKRGKSGMPEISAPLAVQHSRTIAFDIDLEKATSSEASPENPRSPTSSLAHSGFRRSMSRLSTISEGKFVRPKLKKPSHKRKITILREERDRFNAMRDIQNGTRRFKRYFALSMSILAFGILWCIGAVVFWVAESDTTGLSYFEALYFCYVSLLTIGYGDLSPKSNAGKPFFVIWSLLAVPTMTILISDLSDTIIASYKRGTFTIADWSIMPKKGLVNSFLEKHPRIQNFVEQWKTNKRIERGFIVGPGPLGNRRQSTIEELASRNLDEHDMAKRLARAIRRTASDLKVGSTKRYSYEEWADFTQLIRFTSYKEHATDFEKGLINWDWIGEDSPMMADVHECEWVLDRLCESLDRYMHKMVPEHVKERRRSQAERRKSLMEGRRSFIGSRKGSSGSNNLFGNRKASTVNDSGQKMGSETSGTNSRSSEEQARRRKRLEDGIPFGTLE